MDGGNSGGGGGAAGVGPAPFLMKTYDMVDDSATDDIVSWSAAKNSFVVWNPPEFSRLLLPTYFKHNNFSSFIRQLNTYGFRKIDPERWEFANEDFAKDQKHLLKNIHRRKPIHSHSQPHNSLSDAERMALEEEIERLSREKNALQSELLRFEQQQSGTNAHMDVLEKRLQDMEQRQLRMMSFLAKAINNPSFVEHLIRMAGASVDFSVISKKRRLPRADLVQEIVDNSFIDTRSSTSKFDYGQLFHQDFSNKLKLELCPAVSDSNLVSASVQSSTEDGGCPLSNLLEEDPKAAQLRSGRHSVEPEMLELSDTGTSFGLKKILSLFGQSRENERPEDGEGHVCCQLNLSLASSPVQVNRASYGSSQDLGTSNELRSSPNGKEVELGAVNSRTPDKENARPSTQGPPPSNQGSGAAQARVNDLFWEQFLTERPGSSDTEEAISGLRSQPCDEQEERRNGNGMPCRNRSDMEQLTL